MNLLCQVLKNQVEETLVIMIRKLYFKYHKMNLHLKKHLVILVEKIKKLLLK